MAIIDLAVPAGGDWEYLDARVRAVAGVVDTGLFRVRPGDVFIGAPDGSVRTLADAPLPA